MNVLLIGQGGREHALAHSLSLSVSVGNVYVAPGTYVTSSKLISYIGNGGTDMLSKVSNIKADKVSFDELPATLKQLKISLVVVGPEKPLVEGVVDLVKRCGVPVFGPSMKASQLEGSKAFSKKFMRRHYIPTADYQVFSDFDQASQYVKSVGKRVVLKASGLAAGKGVFLPQTTNEALDNLKTLFTDFMGSSNEIVIEEYLEGEECSILTFTDGFSFVSLPALQDHKRVGEGDMGPNTGGMGAYCPAPCASKSVMSDIERLVIKPTIDGMRKDGIPFVGLLYSGIMLTSDGVKVLEFNCRFGDPETQAVIPLLDCDIFQVMLACAEGHLDSAEVKIKKNMTSAVVVCCSKGYPGQYDIGKSITLPKRTPNNVTVFHSGTKVIDSSLQTAGGRVLSICGIAPTLKESLANVYAVVDEIEFEGKFCRRDIGHRALHTSSNKSATYAEAGVSIDKGNELVEKIKAVVKSTRRPGTEASIGGFGGMFDLNSAGFKSDCVLVSATDGVGTKLKIAQIMNKHDTIGIDLVAMNVNDLIVQGAEPLFFLDYFACGSLDVEVTKSVVSGIATGCIEAGCALIGGETAEMPGMYQNGDYDLAGFTVGAVKPENALPQGLVQAGDVVIGLPSSGIHSNGYSLVRHIIKTNGFDYHAPAPFQSENSQSLGNVLLVPTRIYVKQLLPIVQSKIIKAMAHITGGGFIDNIPRVLPDNIHCTLDATKWPLPPVFTWLMKSGNLSAAEMCRTFNCGIGMILIVSPESVDEIMKQLQAQNDSAYIIGQLFAQDANSSERVTVSGTEKWTV